jgi:hypothetical protein
MLPGGQDGRGALGSPSGKARKSIGAVADERQVVGNRRGLHAELGDDARFVIGDLSHPIAEHDPLALDQLSEVLVDGAYDDLLDAWINPEASNGRGDPIVGLVLDHGPDGHPEGLERSLGVAELGQEIGVHPSARLVAGIQVVAPRLDDVVGRRADVRDVGLAEQ